MSTKNYRLFTMSKDNRALDLKKHRKLRESMRSYGFLWSFPVVCVRSSSGGLIVKDGQHRVAIAEELGLEVWYVVSDLEFDVATINCTPRAWGLIDYARKYAADGRKDYQDGLDFMESYRIPVSFAFALLAGTASFGNIVDPFRSGEFRVKDRDWANRVGMVYSSLVSLNSSVRSVRCLEACMAICRVETFDSTRLLRNAEKCREKLVSYSTREAYLELFENTYNFCKKTLVPLKIQSLQAMRERNAVPKAKK